MNFSPTHAIHGFKTAFAAVLAYTITSFFHLELGHWAVISTVIVMQIYVADSVALCLYRFSGTILGALIGTLVILIIPETPLFMGIALFFTIGFCSFLTCYKPRYRMAAITAVILIMTGVHAENIVLFGLSRVFEISIGILSAFLVSVLIFPRRGVDVLMEKLESQSKACSEKCRILVDAFTAGQKNVEETLVDELVKDVWGNHELLQKVNQHEALIYHKNVNTDLSDKVSIMSRSAEHLRNMVRTLNVLDGNGYDIILSKELKDLAEESGKTLELLMKNQPLPAVIPLEDRVKALDTGLLNLREKGLIRRFDSKRLVQVFSFYSSLLYFAEDILAKAKKIQANTRKAESQPS
ncbi:FUSC family protein [Desulfospira joergensenii]|uniref:FUSC family protein n=1 Tax=Desulfospira joergensenii TaxID=53329 RepID=UPI0003B5FA8A|nr:FUSC family protein [Desulfospira joergensenii]